MIDYIAAIRASKVGSFYETYKDAPGSSAQSDKFSVRFDKEDFSLLLSSVKYLYSHSDTNEIIHLYKQTRGSKLSATLRAVYLASPELKSAKGASTVAKYINALSVVELANRMLSGDGMELELESTLEPIAAVGGMHALEPEDLSEVEAELDAEAEAVERSAVNNDDDAVVVAACSDTAVQPQSKCGHDSFYEAMLRLPAFAPSPEIIPQRRDGRPYAAAQPKSSATLRTGKIALRIVDDNPSEGMVKILEALAAKGEL